MRSRFLILLAITALAVVTPVVAQDLQWHFGGGWSLAQGKSADRVDDGYHLMFGALKPLPVQNLSLRLDGTFDAFDSNSFSLTEFNAEKLNARVWSAIVDAQYNFTPGSRVHFYGFGGVGAHYKQATLTRPGLGWGTVCDPWWGWCYPVAGVGDVVQAHESSFNGGLNGGLGLAFPLGQYSRTQMFVEGKYQWINGDQGAQYVPITIGIRG